MISVVARVIAAALLFWALDHHPYDYYTILRWVVSATVVYAAYLAKSLTSVLWCWILGVVAAFFNPVVPVHLRRETWAVIDVVTGVLFLASIVAVREPARSSGSDGDD